MKWFGLMYDRDLLVRVLIHHTRTDNSGCTCGGTQLGESYAHHVADVYERYLNDLGMR